MLGELECYRKLRLIVWILYETEEVREHTEGVLLITQHGGQMWYWGRDPDSEHRA